MKPIFNLIMISCFFIASCGTQRKIEETRKVLKTIKEGKEKENGKLTAVNESSLNKLKEGKIEKNIKHLIDERLERYRQKIDSTGKTINQIELLMEDKKIFKKEYKSVVVPALDSLKKDNSLYDKRLTIYMMIEDGLNIADYHLFDLAAFFGPGKHIIPDDKVEFARESFAPIVDSLINFSSKYNDKPRTGSLLILGFADGTGFSEGPLYDTLKALIGKAEVTKEELNLKLSELRAGELIKHLEQIYYQKKKVFTDINDFRVEYIGQGKGEEYPLPTIKDYMVEDARRRIVLCYWVVLPD